MLIRKVIAVEKKSCHRPASQIKKIDQYCPKGYHSSLQTSKLQYQKIIQGQGIMNNLHQYEPKSLGSAPLQRNDANRSGKKSFDVIKNFAAARNRRSRIDKKKVPLPVVLLPPEPIF